MRRVPTRSTRAVAYIRVSKERDGMISPENQLFAINELARRKGMEVVQVFQDLDESGRTFEKRATKRIIDAIRAGEYPTILLWKWSRWGRNVEHSKAYLAGVRDAGGHVESATEDIDQDTSTGRFTLNLLLALAELESDKKSETWKDAHDNGGVAGSPTRPVRTPDTGTTRSPATWWTRRPAPSCGRPTSATWTAPRSTASCSGSTRRGCAPRPGVPGTRRTCRG